MTDIANAYAQALYGLAKEAEASERILDETRALREAMEDEPGFIRVLCAPEIGKAERCALIDSCFKSLVHEYVRSTLKLMTEKGHIRFFCACCEKYGELYNEDHGILTVGVFSSRRPDESQMARLKAKLESVTGKRVNLRFQTDETCIGGIRLEYAGRSIDDTVKHRLSAVEKLLHSAAV